MHKWFEGCIFLHQLQTRDGLIEKLQLIENTVQSKPRAAYILLVLIEDIATQRECGLAKEIELLTKDWEICTVLFHEEKNFLSTNSIETIIEKIKTLRDAGIFPKRPKCTIS